MNKSKLKTLTIEELKTRRDKIIGEISEVRFDLRIGQEKDYSVIKKKKKELSRINTFLQGSKLGIYTPEDKPKAKTEKKDDKKEKVVAKRTEKTDKEEKENRKK